MADPPDEELREPPEPLLPDALAGYQPAPQQDLEKRRLDYTAAAAEHDILLARLEILDLQWALEERPRVKTFFFGLLIVQNVVVLLLVIIALFWGKLSDLQTVFSVLVGATLVETAAIVKFIVQFLFSPKDYKNLLTRND